MVIAIKNSVSIACHTKHTEGDFVAGWLASCVFSNVVSSMHTIALVNIVAML